MDSQAYFDSLTPAEQDEAFGKGNAEAIRNGADISQVVNASDSGGVYVIGRKRYTKYGTTRRGFYGRTGTRERRPTPSQVIADARGNKEQARADLARFGYIVS